MAIVIARRSDCASVTTIASPANPMMPAKTSNSNLGIGHFSTLLVH
jgi:hypothetical protein